MAEPLTFTAGLALVLSSSVLAAGLTQVITVFRERGNVKREVSYLALRLATKFENYAQEAATYVGSVHSFRNDPREGVSLDLPILEALPSEQERWRDLDVMLTSEVLCFDSDRRAGQARIDEEWEEDTEAAIDIARDQAIMFGIRALHLSTMLRKSHKLPPFDTENPWLEFLIDEYEQLPEHTKERFSVGAPALKWWKRGPFMMLPQRSF